MTRFNVVSFVRIMGTDPSVLCLLALAGVGCAADTAGPVRDGNGFGSNTDVTVAGPTAGVGGTVGPGTMDPPVVNPGGGPGTVGGPGGSGGALPCAVNEIIVASCQNCHGATPIGGAPMSLVTHADFQKDHVSFTTMPGATMKVYEWVKLRVNDAARPMPAGALLPAAELGVLNAWLDQAAPLATAAEACADDDPTMMPVGENPRELIDGPLIPRAGETCYDLTTHEGQTVDDTSPYMVKTGEHYEQFYYDVPWTTPMHATRFGSHFDNKAILHHWLLFTTGGSNADGSHETVLGTQLGDSNSSLLAGWAVGGAGVAMPDDVEFELPPPGTKLTLQWHYYNTTNSAQPDATKVQVCAVPPGTRPNVGSMTWLGTENFNGFFGMPPGQESDYKGTCINESGGPIHIFGLWPHMHQLGRNMKSVVTRAAGGTEEVFNLPFDFNYQIPYEADVTLMPGDRIVSTCTFNNTTSKGVPFGPSSDQEMCYQFASSYPAGALDNGVISLIGSKNTCWQFGE